MKKSRFAFYLTPPYEITRDVAEIHSMLEKQYGFRAAERFQIHCTVKGFFKKNEGSITPLINALEKLLQNEKPIPVEINGIVSRYSTLMLDLSRIGDTYNKDFTDFRNRVFDIIQPYIAPDCDFIEDDLRQPFMGHITLAFRDSPEEMHSQVLRWLDSAPVPSGRFLATDFHFLEIWADDWDGPWWETLTWKIYKSWRLQ